MIVYLAGMRHVQNINLFLKVLTKLIVSKPFLKLDTNFEICLLYQSDGNYTVVYK